MAKVLLINICLVLFCAGVLSFNTIDHFTDSQCTQSTRYARETYKPEACPVKMPEPICTATEFGTYYIVDSSDCMNQTLPNLIDSTWTIFTGYANNTCSTDYSFARFEFKDPSFSAVITDSFANANFTYSCDTTTGIIMVTYCDDVTGCENFSPISYDTCVPYQTNYFYQTSCKAVKPPVSATPTSVPTSSPTSGTAPVSSTTPSTTPTKKSSAGNALVVSVVSFAVLLLAM